MTNVRKATGVAAVVGSALLAGLIGATVLRPGSAGAQTTTPTPKATSTSGTFHSNESKTHEAGETAQREADENSGRFRGGRCHGGSNESKTHEAGESAAREAQENANRPAATASPSA